MRILIVDDNDQKRARVASVLSDGLAAEGAKIEEAATYEAALDKLKSLYFDLVVLDLLLPAADGTPSQDSSRAIIRQLNSGAGLLPPMHIIGLTAYENIAEQERAYFDQHLLSLEYYSEDNVQWAEKIVSKIIYLMQSQRASLRFHSSTYDLDVFVLAARHQNEYIPAKSKLFDGATSDHHPLWKGAITLGSIKLSDGRILNAGLACVNEMGMAPTAAVASQAISIFRPRLLGMIGMCCGFHASGCAHPRKLMDAIVVREVTCWEEGKYVDLSKNKNEFRNRAKTRIVDDVIREDVEMIIEQAESTIIPSLKKFTGKAKYKKIRDHFNAAGDGQSVVVRDVPDVKFAPLVSGSSVIADNKMVEEILSRHTGAVGLDMELFGLYAAADRSFGRRPSVLGVKGVADFGQVEKDDNAQEGATIVSVEVFRAILENLQIFKSERLE